MAKKKPKSIFSDKKVTVKEWRGLDAARQQAILANPRKRKRVVDAALPRAYYDKRIRARFLRNPITPGGSETGRELESRRRYMETLTFGEGDRQLADRTQSLADARARDADWFTKYRAEVAAAQGRAIGAQGAAIEGNRALINSANDVAVSGRDSVVRQLQDRAAQLGQVSQAGDYQAIADQAAAARAASLANTAQRQVADAATDVGLATNAVGTAGLKDLEARGYRDRQNSALDLDKRDYGAKKDAWREKFINDAISEARKQVLEDKAFALNAADKAADNARADSSLRLQRKRLAEQRRAARERERLARERAANSGGGSRSSGPKPATPKETRSQAAAIRRAITLIRGYKAKNTPTGQIRQGLAVKGIDSDVVNTAMDVVYLGGIGRVNRRRWRKAGYNPRDFGQPFK